MSNTSGLFGITFLFSWQCSSFMDVGVSLCRVLGALPRFMDGFDHMDRDNWSRIRVLGDCGL